MRLSSVFNGPELIRDADVRLTLPPKSQRSGTVCYAMDAGSIDLVNANPCIVAVITTPELAEGVAEQKGCVVSKMPRRAFFEMHGALYRSGEMVLCKEGSISPDACIAPTAVLGRNVVIEAGVVVGHYAVIEDFSVIGEGTRIGAHAVIGGNALQDTHIEGTNVLVEFAGGVRVGKRCEILSGALIQRTYLCNYTEISDDVKIGPGASVGHECSIGRGTSISAGAVIAGGVKVGTEVWIGASATVSDSLTIGDKARVQIGSVVIGPVAAGAVVSGNFALPHAQHLRIHTKHRYDR